MGLTGKFTHSKSHIMMMNSLSNIDKISSLVIQQGREMNNSISVVTRSIDNNEEIVALQVHTYSGNSNGKHGNNYFKGKTQGYSSLKGHNRVCTHCGGTNHTIEIAFSSMDFHQDSKAKTMFKMLELILNLLL